MTWRDGQMDDGGTIGSTTSAALGDEAVSCPRVRNRREFRRAAGPAKQECPVSKAPASVPEISLDARLRG